MTDHAHQTPAITTACQTIIAEIERRRINHRGPFLVALDGRSGSGKSTIATQLARQLDAALVQSDDFFAANIPDPAWDSRTAAEKVRDGIDWRRLRVEALEPLLAGQVARWHAFDFVSGIQPDGTYLMLADYEERQPNEIIIVDGAYAARPELADLIDLAVLVEIPDDVRRARLALREDAAFLTAWHARWDEAEALYFTQIRPPAAFDLVVTNGE